MFLLRMMSLLLQRQRPVRPILPSSPSVDGPRSRNIPHRPSRLPFRHPPHRAKACNNYRFPDPMVLPHQPHSMEDTPSSNHLPRCQISRLSGSCLHNRNPHHGTSCFISRECTVSRRHCRHHHSDRLAFSLQWCINGISHCNSLNCSTSRCPTSSICLLLSLRPSCRKCVKRRKRSMPTAHRRRLSLVLRRGTIRATAFRERSTRRSTIWRSSFDLSSSMIKTTAHIMRTTGCARRLQHNNLTPKHPTSRTASMTNLSYTTLDPIVGTTHLPKVTSVKNKYGTTRVLEVLLGSTRFKTTKPAKIWRRTQAILPRQFMTSFPVFTIGPSAILGEMCSRLRADQASKANHLLQNSM